MNTISFPGRIAQLTACGLTAALLVSGCGGGDDDSDDGDRSPTTTVATTTATTHPPASDEAGAFSLVEDLELEAATIADELYQNPEKVTDPDDPDVARLREIYTDDSPTPDGVTENVEQLARDGQKVQAVASQIWCNSDGAQAPVIRLRGGCDSFGGLVAGGVVGVVELLAQLGEVTGDRRRVGQAAPAA